MIHPEIRQFWLDKHPSYHIFKETNNRWVLYSNNSHIATIAFIYRKDIFYYTKLHGIQVLREKEMLSYIKLQAFL